MGFDPVTPPPPKYDSVRNNSRASCIAGVYIVFSLLINQLMKKRNRCHIPQNLTEPCYFKMFTVVFIKDRFEL